MICSFLNTPSGDVLGELQERGKREKMNANSVLTVFLPPGIAVLCYCMLRAATGRSVQPQ